MPQVRERRCAEALPETRLVAHVRRLPALQERRMNPFQTWKQEDVQRHNERVAGKKEVGTTDRADGGATTVRSPVTTGERASEPNTRQFVIHTDPVPAPRMTRSDKWRTPRRPCVQRYFDYRDTLQRAIGDLPIVPDELHCVFHVAMPESWSKKKRAEMSGKPHRTRPDRDNMDKAISDALFLEDGGVWKGSQEKRWSEQGRVELTMVWLTSAPLTIHASEVLEQERK